MKISTRGRYALRMIAHIAYYQNRGNVSISDISKVQQISIKYLEQIASKLVKWNYIKSTRGKQGGYVLSRSAKDISVGDVLLHIEGSLAPVACLAKDPTKCPKYETCFTIKMWEELEKITNDYLNNVSIQDLLNQYDSANVPFDGMYI